MNLTHIKEHMQDNQKLEINKKFLFKILLDANFMAKGQLSVFVELLDSKMTDQFLKLYS